MEESHAGHIPTIPAKTIVNKSSSAAWFGAEYNMNIYRGCSHGCIYCDSRSECYRNTAFDTVHAKADALAIIRRDLRAKQRKGVVATGSMSDPYNPWENKLGLTRQALALLAQFGFGVAIATKSPLVTRDIDLLRDIRQSMPAIVKITITTPSDALAKTIEPHAAPSSARFEALATLAGAGIYCGVLLMPTLPFITDEPEEIRLLVRRAAEAGASFLYPSFGVTLRDIQRAHYYEKLDAHFHGLRRRYQQEYGNAYACGSPRAKELHAAFAEECHRLHLQYKMRDIVLAYQGAYRQEQTSLFDP